MRFLPAAVHSAAVKFFTAPQPSDAPSSSDSEDEEVFLNPSVTSSGGMFYLIRNTKDSEEALQWTALIDLVCFVVSGIVSTWEASFGVCFSNSAPIATECCYFFWDCFWKQDDGGDSKYAPNAPTEMNRDELAGVGATGNHSSAKPGVLGITAGIPLANPALARFLNTVGTVV